MTQGEQLDKLKALMGTAGGGTVPSDPTLRLLLNDAARWVQRECLTRFRRSFLTNNETFSWNVGDQTQELPEDFLGIVAFWRTDLTDPLIHFEEIDEKDVPKYFNMGSLPEWQYNFAGDAMAGKTPFFFSNFNEISLVRPATVAMTAFMRYAALVDPLTTVDATDAAEPFDLPDYTHNAIVWRALAESAFGESDMVNEANAYLEREMAQVGSVLEAVRGGKHEGYIQCSGV